MSEGGFFLRLCAPGVLSPWLLDGNTLHMLVLVFLFVYLGH